MRHLYWSGIPGDGPGVVLCLILSQFIIVHAADPTVSLYHGNITAHGWSTSYSHEHQILSQEIMHELQQMNEGGQVVLNEQGSHVGGDSMMTSQPAIFGDVLYNVNQSRYMLNLIRSTNRKRRRRKMAPFPSLYWPREEMPIPFAIHASIFFSSNEGDQFVQAIHAAIAQWQAESCITFQENNTAPSIVFAYQFEACFSEVGKNPQSAEFPFQVINLSPACFSRPGTSVHEIGHALGFYHEHTRTDRSQYIDVNFQNIRVDAQPNFLELPSDDFGVKYDPSSVMHYSGVAFAINKTLLTIETVDPLQQQIIGQRTALSFLDTKLMNHVYCSDICSEELLCEHDGYTHPNNCDQCRCPAGWGDRLCELVDQIYSHPDCTPVSGELSVSSDEEFSISSPGYLNNQSYDSYTACAWLVRAPNGCRLRLWFADKFRVFCYTTKGDVCSHWVEIRHKGHLSDADSRFCCYEKPLFNGEEYLVTDDNTAMIVFQSNTLIASEKLRYGFQLFFKIDNVSCLDEHNEDESSTITMTTEDITLTTKYLTTTTEDIAMTTEEMTITTEDINMTTENITMTPTESRTTPVDDVNLTADDRTFTTTEKTSTEASTSGHSTPTTQQANDTSGENNDQIVAEAKSSYTRTIYILVAIVTISVVMLLAMVVGVLLTRHSSTVPYRRQVLYPTRFSHNYYGHQMARSDQLRKKKIFTATETPPGGLKSTEILNARRLSPKEFVAYNR